MQNKINHMMKRLNTHSMMKRLNTHALTRCVNRFLALILMISLTIPMLPVVTVYGLTEADLKFTSQLNSFIDQSSANGEIKPMDRSELARTTAVLQWYFPLSLNRGMYVLRYYRFDGSKVELTVRLLGDRYLINYNVYQYKNGEYVNINHPTEGRRDITNAQYRESDLGYKIFGLASINMSDFVYAKDYFIYNGGDASTRVNNYNPYIDKGTPGSPVYEPLAYPTESDSDPSGRYDNDFYDPVRDKTEFTNLANRLAPSFRVGTGEKRGYRFQYDGVEASFFFRSETSTVSSGTFMFETDDIIKGYIYDFQLEYFAETDVDSYMKNGFKTADNTSSNANGAQFKDTRYIFYGFDPNTINVIPFAEYGDDKQKPYNTLYDLLDGSYENASAYKGGHAPDYYNTEVLELEPGELSAQGNVGIDMRIDLPKVYDVGTHSYGNYSNRHGTGQGDINLAIFDMQITMSTPSRTGNEPQHFTVTIHRFLDNTDDYSQKVNAGPIDPTDSSYDSVAKEVTFDISNYKNSTATIKDVSLLTRSSANASDRVRIRLDNIGPGIVFTSTIINLINTSDASTAESLLFPKWTYDHSQSINRSIYTFLQYSLEDTPNGRVVDVLTYNQYTELAFSGDYSLNLLPSSNAATANSYKDSETGTIPDFMGTKLRFSPIQDNMSMTRIYGITFSRGVTEPDLFYSQIFKFVPAEKKPTVGAANHFEILDELSSKPYVLRPKENALDGSQGTLTFWAKWDLGFAADIEALLDETDDDQMTITYELATALDPNGFDLNNTNADPNTQILVDVNIKRTSAGLLLSYSDNQGFIKDPDTGAPIVDMTPLKLYDQATKTDLLQVEIPFVADAVFRDPDIVTPPPFFQYPNIYYFKVVPHALTRSLTATGKVETSDLRGAIPTSAVRNITLDDLTLTQMDVPPLREFTMTAETDSPSVQLTYKVPGLAVAKYIDSQYAFSPQLWVNIYLSQFEQYMADNLSLIVGARTGATIKTVPYADLVTDEENRLDVRNSPDATAVLRGESASEKILCIEGIPLLTEAGNAYDITQTMAQLNRDLKTTLTLAGLDPNQHYYAFANLTVKQWEDDTYQKEMLDANGEPIVKTSILTGRTGATTTQEGDIPDPAEKVPSTPQLTVEENSVTQSAATLVWNNIGASVDESGEGVRIEYELIRIKGQQMPEQVFKAAGGDGKDLGAILYDIGFSDMMAWRTNGTTIDRIHPTNETDVGGYANNIVSFTDTTLQPNQVYFYYIRTRRTVETTTRSEPDPPTYSSWDHATVTTIPIQSPFNLKILTDKEYDHQTEVMISFDIPAIDLNMEGIGADYNIQMQLKTENEDWGPMINMDLTQLTNPENYTIAPDNSSINFLYKISHLTPNTLYLIRLRLYDESTQVGSLYSETKSFKTDVDMDIYEDERKLAEWLEYLKKLLTAMLTDPYWTARETAAELVVVYRPGDMFQGLLSATHDAAILLYNNQADQVTYYIPATALQRANDSNKGFRGVYDDLELLFSPKMVNASYNAAVSAMADALSEKEISDYFVKLSITRSRVNRLIEDEEVLGKQTAIAIEMVGVKPEAAASIKAWDDAMYAQFAKVLNDMMDDPTLRNALMDQVQKDTVSRDMLDYVEQLVSDNKADILKKVYDQLNTSASGILSTHTAAVSKLDAPMILLAKGLDASAVVSGYQLQQGNWMPRTVSRYYNGMGLSATTPGTYAFTGHNISIPGINETVNGGTITALTAKYGLDDYLGRDGINLQQTASRLTVAGCVARLAGAPKTADPISWISSNLNMTLSSRNTTGRVQTQEALAMVMALYEKKTGTKVSSMTIRNYNTTANMTGLDKRYTQAVRGAFELGLVSDTNVRPTSAITTEALLEILAALDSKIKL